VRTPRQENQAPQAHPRPSRVRVRVELPGGQKSRAARLAYDATVSALIPELISILELPIIDSSGRPYEYRLQHEGRAIGAGETLGSIGVTDGSGITIEQDRGSFPTDIEREYRKLMSFDLERSEMRKVRNLLEELGTLHQSLVLWENETDASEDMLRSSHPEAPGDICFDPITKEIITTVHHHPLSGGFQRLLRRLYGVGGDGRVQSSSQQLARLVAEHLARISEQERRLAGAESNVNEAMEPDTTGNSGARPCVGGRTTIRLHLDRGFDAFRSAEAEALMETIAGRIGADGGDLRLVRVEPGSVKVTVTLGNRLARQLLELYEGGELEDLAVATLEFCANEKAGTPVAEVMDLTLRVELDHNAPVRCSLEGARTGVYPSAGSFSPDLLEMNRAMDEMGRDMVAGGKRWLRSAKSEGRDLYRKLFSTCEGLKVAYGKATGWTGEDHAERCQLVFSGPRDYLAMPWEFLREDGFRWLVHRHPLCRHVTGLACERPSFQSLLTQLRKSGQPLRVLLLASAEHGIGNTKQEICSVRKRIEDGCRNHGLARPVFSPETPAVGEGDADTGLDHVAVVSSERAIDLMGDQSYHIIHYAGHGVFDPENPQESGLRLLDADRYVTLPNQTLHDLLCGRDTTELVYLSCCDGAKVADKFTADGGDFLGVLDAVVMSGVPIALGYRWFVKDMEATVFADGFYQSLFKTLSPSQASLYARRKIGLFTRGSMTDETSLSPILVVQNI
jgi:hypothetical protein